jgi:L-asparaginase / beta-aspartyl-peptidase
LDRQGRVGWAHNSSDMACAYMTELQDKPTAFTRRYAQKPDSSGD